MFSWCLILLLLWELLGGRLSFSSQCLQLEAASDTDLNRRCQVPALVFDWCCNKLPQVEQLRVAPFLISQCCRGNSRHGVIQQVPALRFMGHTEDSAEPCSFLELWGINQLPNSFSLWQNQFPCGCGPGVPTSLPVLLDTVLSIQGPHVPRLVAPSSIRATSKSRPSFPLLLISPNADALF